MTITHLNEAPNSEFSNTHDFIARLRRSEPDLDDPRVRLCIASSIYLPSRQLDLVLIFEDSRPAAERFRTSQGVRVDSFVAVIEVKRHPPDHVKVEGRRVLVQYGEKFHDATSQSDQQKYALVTYQKSTDHEGRRREATWVCNVIWLAETPRETLPGQGALDNVVFQDLSWAALLGAIPCWVRSTKRAGEPEERHTDTLDRWGGSSSNRHSHDSMVELLSREMSPTKLDLEKIRRTNQTRFDAERTQYIQNLGQGLLVLRGRAGTGKTFSLLQLAMHLARRGKRVHVVSFNHGLLADISRSLRIIKDREPSLAHVPTIGTRYELIADLYRYRFGQASDSHLTIGEREAARTAKLLGADLSLQALYDFVLIDEGQDWSAAHRDLMYKAFGPGNVIVADGVDQFVSGDRCDWVAEGVPVNRVHGLRVSRRTKGSTCRTVGAFARRIGVEGWDIEPDPNIYGGRLTVLVEPDPLRALDKVLDIMDDDLRRSPGVEPIDNLICLPAPKAVNGVNYPALLERALERRNALCWRGFDEEDRRTYPEFNDRVRAVLYQSCRGMEGWSAACMAFDHFYDHQMSGARIDTEAIEAELRVKHGFLFEPKMVGDEAEARRRVYANQWAMIPLTRSVDHLIVHLCSKENAVGRAFTDVSREFDGSVAWRR